MILCVQLAPGRHKHAGDLNMLLLKRPVQWGATAFAYGVRVGTGLKQCVNGIPVAANGCHMQRRFSRGTAHRDRWALYTREVRKRRDFTEHSRKAITFH